MRFIPAYTGNGDKHRAGKILRAVYPRVYGERAANEALRQMMSRFIPAYTGNGGHDPGRDNLQTVYPRVYGERIPICSCMPDFSGLSPRIRGTVHF